MWNALRNGVIWFVYVGTLTLFVNFSMFGWIMTIFNIDESPFGPLKVSFISAGIAGTIMFLIVFFDTLFDTDSKT